MRADQPVREQVQAQVGVGGVGGRLREVGDDGGDRGHADAAQVVAARRVGQLARQRALDLA